MSKWTHAWSFGVDHMPGQTISHILRSSCQSEPMLDHGSTSLIDQKGLPEELAVLARLIG